MTARVSLGRAFATGFGLGLAGLISLLGLALVLLVLTAPLGIALLVVAGRLSAASFSWLRPRAARITWFLGDGTLSETTLEEAQLVRHALSRKVDVRWLSDTDVDDLRALEVRLGLPALPVAATPTYDESPMYWWKGAAVVDHLVERRGPAIWTEAGLDEESTEGILDEPIGTCVIEADGGLGAYGRLFVRAFIKARGKNNASIALLRNVDL